MTNLYDVWVGGAIVQMNLVYTQANAAGGAVVCEIGGNGGECEFVCAAVANSGTNGINVDLENGVAGTTLCRFAAIGSGAGTTLFLGQDNTSGAKTTGQPGGIAGVRWQGAQALKIYQTAAGAQNDTFTVGISLRVKGLIPVVTHANSTNPANVSVTSGSEFFLVA